jgi:hypothetical protein
MNTTTHDQKRGPGRPRKEEAREERARRRKRADDGEVIGKRLGVRKSALDLRNFAYRWVNDNPARIQAMTQEDDWDLVSNDGDEVKEDTATAGSAVTQVVGTHPDGSPKLAYLCRKPKTYFEEDQKERQAELDKQLAELRRGATRNGELQSDYIPSTGISV